MAGGIDWFRWHHGSVTDQKFPLVARRAGASVAEVIAVWACLLERASMNEDERGMLGDTPDFEAMDCALGVADGKCAAIFDALRQRSLIDEHLQIAAWPKRQPKREDDSAAERKRRQREREHELQMAERVTGSESRSVTQGHADVTHGHDRGEESREEERTPKGKTTPARKRADACPCPDGVTDGTWADWLTLRKSKRAPVTATVVREAEAEAKKAGMSLDAFLRVWCARGSQGLQADWLRPQERGSPKAAEMSKWIKGTSLDPDFRGYDDGVIDAAPALR